MGSQFTVNGIRFESDFEAALYIILKSDQLTVGKFYDEAVAEQRRLAKLSDWKLALLDDRSLCNSGEDGAVRRSSSEVRAAVSAPYSAELRSSGRRPHRSQRAWFEAHGRRECPYCHQRTDKSTEARYQDEIVHIFSCSSPDCTNPNDNKFVGWEYPSPATAPASTTATLAVDNSSITPNSTQGSSKVSSTSVVSTTPKESLVTSKQQLASSSSSVVVSTTLSQSPSTSSDRGGILSQTSASSTTATVTAAGTSKEKSTASSPSGSASAGSAASVAVNAAASQGSILPSSSSGVDLPSGKSIISAVQKVRGGVVNNKFCPDCKREGTEWVHDNAVLYICYNENCQQRLKPPLERIVGWKVKSE